MTEFTPDKLKVALKGIKAPGFDGILPATLKELGKMAEEGFLQLLSGLLR